MLTRIRRAAWHAIWFAVCWLARTAVSPLRLRAIRHAVAIGTLALALCATLAAATFGRAVALGAYTYSSGTTGFDISWPQCGGAYPATPFGFGIVGVADGRADTQNPCLASEYAWAKHATASAPSVYMNLNYGLTRGTCARKDKACQAYTYGYDAARQAMSYASSQAAAATMWWLDIETGNTWSSTTSLNAQIIHGALASLQAAAMTVGIYSTPYQWGVIAGTYAPGVPNWSAGAPASAPASFCTPTHAFGGGVVWLTQYPNGHFDGDYAC